MDSRKVCR